MKMKSNLQAREARAEMQYRLKARLGWGVDKFTKWYTSPHTAFDGRSPHQMILAGKSSTVLNYIKWLFDV